MNKQSMPHIDVKDKGAIDLYFELMTQKERREFFKDLLRGRKVKLPNFGNGISNTVKVLQISDLDDSDRKLIERFLSGKDSKHPKLEYDEWRHKYKLKAAGDFKVKEFRLVDIPEKRKYLYDRTKEIYDNLDGSVIDKIMDSIVIVLRKQKEKGASNHKLRKVYVSLNELDKHGIKNEKQFLEYLNNPESVVTHEVTHIFQNVLDAFPHVKYLKKNKDGKWEIDYGKYRTDLGEIQARVEQILELIDCGFSKSEVAEMLYSRKYNDKDLWVKMVDEVDELRSSSSRLPGIDGDEDVENEQGRLKNDYHKKDRGKNYEKDYLSGGTLKRERIYV